MLMFRLRRSDRQMLSERPCADSQWSLKNHNIQRTKSISFMRDVCLKIAKESAICLVETQGDVVGFFFKLCVSLRKIANN